MLIIQSHNEVGIWNYIYISYVYYIYIHTILSELCLMWQASSHAMNGDYAPQAVLSSMYISIWLAPENQSYYHHQIASINYSWWRHQMEIFSALLAICAGNSPVSGEFPTQRPVTRSFDIFFDLRLNKRLSKQSWSWWFETLSCPLWRQCNVTHCLGLGHETMVCAAWLSIFLFLRTGNITSSNNWYRKHIISGCVL